ncbi:hypothetical protein LCGC14_2335530, partial [marine sediment metagenome]
MRPWESCAVVVCALAFAGPAGAGSYSDAQLGNWTSSSTWSPSTGYPGSGDTATISTYQVNVNTNLTAAAAPDQITLDGGTLARTNGSNYSVESPIAVNSASGMFFDGVDWNDARLTFT